VGAVSRRRLKKAPAAKKNEVSQEQCVSKGWNFSANRGKRKKRSVSLTNDFILIDVPCYFSTKTRVFCRTLLRIFGFRPSIAYGEGEIKFPLRLSVATRLLTVGGLCVSRHA
jgi:hypothetical protein